MGKTREQLVAATDDWISRNPDAYRALVEATKAISDSGRGTPFKFLIEVLRYNGVLGNRVMTEVVDTLSGITLDKADYAIPNEIVSGIARRISKDMEGYEGFRSNLRKSIFDEPPAKEPVREFEGEVAALF